MLSVINSIKKGTLIASEKSQLKTIHLDHNSNYCAYCISYSRKLLRCSKCSKIYYCQRACQKLDWPFHSQECKCLSKITFFPTASIRLFLRLINMELSKRNELCGNLVSHLKESLEDSNIYVQIQTAYAALLQLSSNKVNITQKEFSDLFCKVRINSFSMTGENGEEIGVALFKQSAKLDHSCQPNAEFAILGNEIKIIACTDIDDLSQVRISYLESMLPTYQRKTELKSRYFFNCNCPLCLDVSMDLNIRIPHCCLDGEILRGPFPAKEYLHTKIYNLASWSSKYLHILPDFKKCELLFPEFVYVCKKCHKLYNVHIIDELEKLVFTKLHTYLDSIELYKACNLSNQAEAVDCKNDYLRSLFNHQDSLIMARLCRTVVLLAVFSEDLDPHSEIKNIVQCGLRCINWIRKFSKFEYQHVCHFSITFIVFLSNAIFSIQNRLENERETISQTGFTNFELLQLCTEAFVFTVECSIDSIRMFAHHLPKVAQDLERLIVFAKNVGLNLDC